MTADFIGPEQDMVMPIHVTRAGPDSQVLKINYCSAYDKIIFIVTSKQHRRILYVVLEMFVFPFDGYQTMMENSGPT